MGKTPFYNLGYIEPSQDLSQELDLDELRFKALDTQLYSLYSVLRNGVIQDQDYPESWSVVTYADDNKFLKVSVSAGKGVVSYKSAETTTAKDVALPTFPIGIDEIKVWIYAVENETTSINKDVDFLSSLVQISDSVNYINVGGVTINTATSSIEVFTTERQNISILSSISSLMYTHKHIGGSLNPAPVDLANHVTGKLSGDNIENVDLNLVTKGKLSANRLSTVSHLDLADKGILTHTQIDSLLTQLTEADSIYTLSDLSIANRLQTIIALKKQSGTGMSTIDSTQINTIVYVPGLFPNNFANASTGTTANFSDRSIPSALIGASINDTGPWNSGLGISSSTSDTVFTDVRTYTTKRDFETAKTYNQNNNIGYLENIKIAGTSNDDLDGSFSISTPLNFSVLEQPINNIFNNSSGWYRGVDTTSNYSDDNVSIDTRLYAYKIFDNPVNLQEASHIGIGFSVGLGATTSKLGQIYMYLVLGYGDTDPVFNNDIKVEFDTGQYFPTTSPNTLYLSSPDGSEIGYKLFDDTDATDAAGIGNSIYKRVDLANLWPSQFRTSVKGLGFYWSSTKGWNPEKPILFELKTPTDVQINPSPYNYNDLLTAKNSTATNSSSSLFSYNESLFSETGRFLLRFDSGLDSTVYNLLQWNVNQPVNTTYSIQTRTDINNSAFSDLNNLDFTGDLASGTFNALSNSGRYLDVLVSMNSNTARSSSPLLNELKITYSTVGTGGTKTYNSRFSNFSTQQSGWETEQYYSKNIGFGATYADGAINKNNMKIADTSTIGNWVYLRNNSAIQAYPSDLEVTFEDGTDTGSMSNYLSPVQIYDSSLSTGFNQPTDFQLLTDGSNIYCDTKNDRIVQFDLTGTITRVIQGNIRLKNTTRDFVALAAYFNPTVNKMWIAFSQNISNAVPIDFTKIFIEFDSVTIRLDDTRIDTNNTGLFEPVLNFSATLEVTFLDNDLGNALVTSIANARTKKVRMDAGAVTNGGSLENSVGLGKETASLPVRKTNNSLTYINTINTTTFSGSATTSTGVPVTIKDEVSTTDFNDDSVIPTDNLLGPDNQSTNVSINIYQGPIYFRNIYNPISVQYSLSKIIVAQPFTSSIVAYNDNAALTTAWTVPYDVASFIDTKLGSVYEISDGVVLVGTPSVDTDNNGKLIKYRVINGLIETKLIFTNLDVVKALPGPVQDQYYVLLDDQILNGINTRLKLIDSSGNVISTWGENYELIHPKGLRLLSNNNILVSE